MATNELLIKRSTLVGIADAIREKTNDTAAIAIPDFADKIDDVYNAGKKAESDAFWDKVQNNNQPSPYYPGAFGRWMTPESFNPKYKTFKIKDNASMVFVQTAYDSEAIDLSGITFSFSNVTSITRMFNNAHIKNALVDFSGVKTLTLIFDASSGGRDKLEDITVKITQDTTSISMLLYYASETKNFYCTSDSVIACNGIDFSTDTALTRASLVSFLNALKDYSGTSGTTYKITFGSTNLAKLTTADKNIATQKGWVLA